MLKISDTMDWMRPPPDQGSELLIHQQGSEQDEAVSSPLFRANTLTPPPFGLQIRTFECARARVQCNLSKRTTTVAPTPPPPYTRSRKDDLLNPPVVTPTNNNKVFRDLYAMKSGCVPSYSSVPGSRISLRHEIRLRPVVFLGPWLPHIMQRTAFRITPIVPPRSYVAAVFDRGAKYTVENRNRTLCGSELRAVALRHLGIDKPR